MMTPRKNRFDVRDILKPVLAVLALFLVINIAFFLIFVRQDLKKLRSVERDSAPQFEALAKLRDQVERQESYLDGLEKATGDLKYFREEVLSTREKRMIDVQDELDKLCGQFNIDLAKVSYDNQVLAAEDLELFRMVVPLEGGYSALRRFLQAVESSDKFILVQSVVLGQVGMDGRVLQLDITLDTYFDAPEGSTGQGSPARGRRSA